MKVKIGDLSLNVVDSGHGEPVLVFLHYWGGSARTWRPVTTILEESFRCVAYDQRGWGTSDAPSDKERYGVADLAADGSDLIRTLGLARYVLVGHSMGGKVAQLLASGRPPGLEGLILVAPAAPMPQNIPEQAKEAQRHAYDNEETALKALQFLTMQLPDNATVNQLVTDSLAGSPGAKYAWPAYTAYEDVSKDVTQINVPTLIIAGDHDPQDPPEHLQREVESRISNATLQIIKNSGHLLPIEQPEALATHIKDFLNDTRNDQEEQG